METTEKDLELFLDLETRLHKKEIRNSTSKVSELLADDFVEFGSSGLIYDRETTLKSLSKETSDFEISVEDFKARWLSSDVVLVNYISNKNNPITNQRTKALRSSIWTMVAGKWKMSFHQGTIVS